MLMHVTQIHTGLKLKLFRRILGYGDHFIWKLENEVKILRVRCTVEDDRIGHTYVHMQRNRI